MKFRVYSIYFDDYSEDWMEVMESVFERKGDDFYLEVDTLEQLKSVINTLTKIYEEKLIGNHDCFNINDEIIVDFKDMTIILYDYYME